MCKSLISLVLLLLLPVSANAFSPNEHDARACFSDASIPAHFAKSTDVFVGAFNAVSDPEIIGFYKVRKVWKGDLKVGSMIKFQLPPYGSRNLTESGKSYLFFLKPKSIPAAGIDPIYVQSSCYHVHPISDPDWSSNSLSQQVQIIEDQSKSMK